MTRLSVNTSPAERARGCSFGELFKSQDKVELNGGTVFGTPTIDFGATLNGTTDYIKYDNFEQSRISGDKIWFDWLFTASFTYEDDLDHFLMSGVPNGHIFIHKTSLNQLYFRIGNTTISLLISGSVLPIWNEFGVNRITASFESGVLNVVYLNGVKIIQNNVLWGPQILVSDLFIGSRWSINQFWPGKILEARIGTGTLNEQEISDFYNNSTYNYRNKAVLDLPMRNAQDNVGVKTLDVSGNENHAVFGAGAATPTKLAKRGYYFDGGDYMTSPSPEGGDFDISGGGTICCLIKPGDLSSNQYIINTAYSSLNRYGLFLSGGSLRFRFGVWNTVSSDYLLSGGHYSICAIFDGVNTSYMYINGIQQSGSTGLSLVPTSGGVVIGARADLAINFFKGSIYHMLVADDILTPLQVADLHNEMMRSINAQ
jgi:hypothetical protein